MIPSSSGRTNYIRSVSAPRYRRRIQLLISPISLSLKKIEKIISDAFFKTF
jgi:hypothetical protein